MRYEINSGIRNIIVRPVHIYIAVSKVYIYILKNYNERLIIEKRLAPILKIIATLKATFFEIQVFWI